MKHPSDVWAEAMEAAAKASEEDVRAAMIDMGESWSDPHDRAAARFRHADAMLAERNK